MTANGLILQIPVSHPCYGGHFPGKPIVPGALLLQWIQALVEERYTGRQLATVKSMKFLALVHPGASIALETSGGHSGKLKVRAFAGSDIICECSFTLEDIPPSQ